MFTERVWPNRAKTTLASVLIVIVAIAFIVRILNAGTNMWNGVRLTPSAALLRGYPLYPRPNEGPVTGHIYGPVSAFCYIPAALLHGPTTTMVAASFISALFYFGPIVLLLRKALAAAKTPSATLLLVYLSAFVGLVTLTCPALIYVAVSVHCDAPALGLATLAIVTLASRRSRFIAYASSAIFAVLSFWCKVTMVGLFPALLLSVLLVDGWQACLRYVACVLTLGIVISLTFILVFGTEGTLFNVFVLPAAHPWGELVMWEPGDVLQQTYPDSIGVRAKGLLVAAGRYCENIGILAVVFPCAAYLSIRRRKRSISSRSLSLLNTSLALVFLITLPISLAAKAKVGGDVNAFAHSLFFALVLTAVWLGISLSESTDPRAAWIPETAFVLMASIMLWAVCGIGPRVINAAYQLALHRGVNGDGNHSAQAYQYAMKYPGEVYFPWYPLSTLLAEGRLYHFAYEVFNRDLIGRRMCEGQFREHIPRNLKYVCLDDASNDKVNGYVLSYLEEYHRVPAPAELKGWHVYARD